ncbi:MAG: RNA polymerase factor sigma-54 [Spirochaetes bacterium]|nr:RNA polymerase factor sigma-54 [Spirochaetota bacterium]
MDLSAKISLKQTGRLALTRQLVQSIELLQLSNVELAEKISSELLENPVLEEENTLILQASTDSERELLTTVDKELSGDEPADQIKEAWDAEYDEKNTPYDAYDDDRKRNFIENAVAQKETLKEHLINQSGITAKDESELLLLETIITSLDDNGFLIVSPEEIAENGPFEIQKVKDAIAVVNHFDPIGCGAANVKESLVVQAMQTYPDDEILLKILNDYFIDLEKLEYSKIAAALHITTSEVIRKSKLVHNLEPFPGIKYSLKKTRYIIPDIEVKYLDEEIIISLNDDWIPKIKINSYYKNILKKKPVDAKLIEYLRNKMQSASNLLSSISNRKETITKVVSSIMEHQREFLINGAGHLKPLVYADIAGEVGLHESTISRTANNKFVQTPWGVFELKYFFVSKLKSKNSEEHSSEEVMALIKGIVAEEDPRNPVSDLEILNTLQKKGINIARRTIAKYRTHLKIAPSNMRKKLNFIKQ